MNVSINCTYLCNFRCSWCYLTKEQLADKNKIDLDLLQDRLQQISKHKQIEHIDLYGGEVGILPFNYLFKLHTILTQYTSTVNVITNLRHINKYFHLPSVKMSVSYDYIYRQDEPMVYENIRKLTQVSILTLGIKQILETDPKLIINKLNKLGNVVSWEIKPYSQNQANTFEIDYTQYEDYILKCLDLQHEMNFKFINKNNILSTHKKTRNSFSDDHIYITPKGKFAVLDFDTNDREYFNELETFEEYIDWTLLEKDRVSKNTFCNSCKYFGRCLSEHLRTVKSLDKSCNGYFNLLEQTKHFIL